MTDVGSNEKPLGFAGVLFAIIAAVVLTDLGFDVSEGASPGHLIAEVSVVIFSLIGVAALWSRLRRLRLDADRLRLSLDETRADAERWRERASDHIRGLAEAIDEQFDAWELTPAEREVALLLLKGLSMKEIASVRGVSPRTVRQQAHVVYKKADLGGRADLSAFFLEDLLLPADQRDEDPAAASS